MRHGGLDTPVSILEDRERQLPFAEGLWSSYKITSNQTSQLLFSKHVSTLPQRMSCRVMGRIVNGYDGVSTFYLKDSENGGLSRRHKYTEVSGSSWTGSSYLDNKGIIGSSGNLGGIVHFTITVTNLWRIDRYGLIWIESASDIVGTINQKLTIDTGMHGTGKLYYIDVVCDRSGGIGAGSYFTTHVGKPGRDY